MKRVLCLYRVSTLKQVDKKDDIPMQRRECMDFIARMDDWEFYPHLSNNKIFLCGILPLISDVTRITILHPFTSVPWIDDFI